MDTRLVRAVSACALVILLSACGPGELTSEQAQAMLDEELPAGMVEVLGVRQTGEGEATARVRIAELAELEMGEIETDVRFELFDTGWRPDGDISLMGQAFPIAQLVDAVNRGKQRRTMALMRNIAVANGTMRVDTGRYAANLAELAPTYMQVVPAQDAWGTAFAYSTGADTYTLWSLGSDGAAGPPPPAIWQVEPFDPEIILTDGQFTQAPMGR